MEFLLGLPHLRKGPILKRARDSGAPVLVSANSFSRWRKHPRGYPTWDGWDMRTLPNLAGMDAALDSGGFVMMARYRGWEFTPAQYMQLAAAYPWRWFAACDLCVERELAGSREMVRNRIASTINLYSQCRREAEEVGIAGRLLPVLQGQAADDFVYCADRFPVWTWPPLVGVGSMCRRAVGGHDGLLAVVDTLDRAFSGTEVRFHLFGIKSAAAAALRGHPRVASTDSQAYGTAARWAALKAGVSKTDSYVADVMGNWYDQQQARLAKPGFAFQASLGLPAPAGVPRPRLKSDAELWKQAETEIYAEFRELVEAGEMDWNALAYLPGAEAEIGDRFRALKDTQDAAQHGPPARKRHDGEIVA